MIRFPLHMYDDTHENTSGASYAGEGAGISSIITPGKLFFVSPTDHSDNATKIFTAVSCSAKRGMTKSRMSSFCSSESSLAPSHVKP